MPSPRKPPDAIQNLLDEAETELSRRLREACEAEARGVSTDSAVEVRQLEDTLLAAAKAVGRAHAARRHMQAAESKMEPAVDAASRTVAGGGGQSASAPTVESDAGGDCDSPTSTAVREFEDSTGRSWRAWPVVPGLARTRETNRKILGDFEEGWICFEALDNSGRRRLPRREPRWSDLPAGDLQRLLDQAIDAPERPRGQAQHVRRRAPD